MNRIDEILSRTPTRNREYDRIGMADDKCYDVILRICKHFVADFRETDSVRKLYSDLIKYFNGVNGKYNIARGLLFIGGYGVGKTHTLNVFSTYTKITRINFYKIIHVKNIVRAFTKNGYEGTEKYSYNPIFNKHNILNNNPQEWGIDDLGKEAHSVKHFGSSSDVIGELISDRYDLWKDNGIRTHATTNMTPEKIRDTYGDYIAERIKEMFQFIVIDRQNFRNQK